MVFNPTGKWQPVSGSENTSSYVSDLSLYETLHHVHESDWNQACMAWSPYMCHHHWPGHNWRSGSAADVQGIINSAAVRLSFPGTPSPNTLPVARPPSNSPAFQHNFTISLLPPRLRSPVVPPVNKHISLQGNLVLKWGHVNIPPSLEQSQVHEIIIILRNMKAV